MSWRNKYFVSSRSRPAVSWLSSHFSGRKLEVSSGSRCSFPAQGGGWRGHWELALSAPEVEAAEVAGARAGWAPQQVSVSLSGRRWPK